MAASKRPVVPSSNLEAARTDDRRAALVKLRDTLASSLDECDPNMHAQLAGQYRATLSELASLEPAKGKSTRDELKDRRAARAAGRGAASQAPASAGGDRKH